MGNAIDDVAAACVRTVQTGSMIVRGTPAFAGWWLGWLSNEFAPHVLTGHALSAIPSPLVAKAAKMANQRADKVLNAALTDTFGESYHDQGPPPARAVHGPPPTHLGRAVGDAEPAGERHHQHQLRTGRPQPSARRVEAARSAGGASRPGSHPGPRRRLVGQRQARSGLPADEQDGRSRLDLRVDRATTARSPWAWPSHIVDVKRAIAWVRANIAEYGGDPEFIAITGGSAGGHLSSLAALTAGDQSLQPGFEDADTSVQAAARTTASTT